MPVELGSLIVEAYTEYIKSLEAFDSRAAYVQITRLIDAANKHLDDTKPWLIKDDEKALASSLLACVELLYHITVLVAPFLPKTKQKME